MKSAWRARQALLMAAQLAALDQRIVADRGGMAHLPWVASLCAGLWAMHTSLPPSTQALL